MPSVRQVILSLFSDIDEERLERVLRGYNSRNIIKWDNIRALLAKEDPPFLFWSVSCELVLPCLTLPILSSRSVLGRYLERFSLGGSRRNKMTKTEKEQAILEEMERDPLSKRGPRTVKNALAIRGIHIERSNFITIDD